MKPRQFFLLLMAVTMLLSLSSFASEEGRRKAQAYIVQGKTSYPTKSAAKTSRASSHKVAKNSKVNSKFKNAKSVKTAQYSAKKNKKSHVNRVAGKSSDGN